MSCFSINDDGDESYAQLCGVATTAFPPLLTTLIGSHVHEVGRHGCRLPAMPLAVYVH